MLDEKELGREIDAEERKAFLTRFFAHLNGIKTSATPPVRISEIMRDYYDAVSPEKAAELFVKGPPSHPLSSDV
jgi:hypothetical protein